MVRLFLFLKSFTGEKSQLCVLVVHSRWSIDHSQEDDLTDNPWTINYNKSMSILSAVFWAIFVVPFVIFLIWLMRQDKRKGSIGLIVLALMVIGGIIYMYVKTGGQ